jgi:hypothetical protein
MAMSDYLLAANVAQGGPMIGALLAIAVVVGLVYLVRGRRGSHRDRGSDRGPGAGGRSPEE